jgi:ABC-type sulfate/molybdate transport systems ATPase subunit
VFQNVRYPAELQGISGADELAQGLVRRFRLEPIARAFPAQISGGERQRVAMARALAARPRLLLWDEPLAALDAVAQDELLDLLREVLEREAVPMVLVTHDAATAFSLAHRCLVLDHGQSVFFGTLEDLLRRPPNAFCARFLGLENVFRPPDLAAAPHSPFVRWLAAHAGSSGVAFPADRVQWSAGAGQGWKGRLRRMRTTPRGTEVLVDVQGVAVRALSTRAANGGSLPRDTEIWIRLEEDALVPILRKEGGDGSLETRA